MSEANMAERRREPRRRVLKAAKIMIDKKSVISCTARSLSAHGTRLAVDSVVGIPDEFEIAISGEPQRQARIVWRTHSELGVILV